MLMVGAIGKRRRMERENKMPLAKHAVNDVLNRFRGGAGGAPVAR